MLTQVSNCVKVTENELTRKFCNLEKDVWVINDVGGKLKRIVIARMTMMIYYTKPLTYLFPLH